MKPKHSQTRQIHFSVCLIVLSELLSLSFSMSILLSFVYFCMINEIKVTALVVENLQRGKKTANEWEREMEWVNLTNEETLKMCKPKKRFDLHSVEVIAEQ